MTAQSVERAAPTRRERLRAQTATEIKQVARQHLVAAGNVAGVQLRSVARDVGMTAPALYRYFPGLDELVLSMTVDLFDELIGEMEAARDSVEDDVAAQMVAVSRAFRSWSVAHPAEFAMIFGTPAVSFGHGPVNECEEAGARFGTVFAQLFIRLWNEHPFAAPTDDDLGEALAAEIAPYHEWLTVTLAPSMPKGAVIVFLEAWVKLYGVVALEVFGHLQWAIPDGEPLFERTLKTLSAEFGIGDRYRPPTA